MKCSINQPAAELKPPCIDDIRKLKPMTPIKVSIEWKYERNLRKDFIKMHCLNSNLQLETSTLRRGMFATTSDAEFRGDCNSDQISKTLPRNYNKSSAQITNIMAPLTPAVAAAVLSSSPMLAMPVTVQPTISTTSAATTTTTTATPSTQSTATPGRQAGVLEYFDLDHSNKPPICNNSTISASTSNLNTHGSASGGGVGGGGGGGGGNGSGAPWQSNLSHRLSSVSISSSIAGNSNTSNDTIVGTTNPLNTNLPSGNAATASGIVYKSVDFIKTEAFMRTRQDAELARAKNRSKE